MNFLYQQWTPEECDALAVRFIPVKLLAEEAELNQTKFWDYRFMHPSQATQAFAEAYAAALKRAVSRRTDLWVGLNMRGLKKGCIFELDARAITGFWKGRQMADRIGCPYDFYCEHAMQFADKARMTFLPSSSQLYTQTIPEHLQHSGLPSMVEYIVERWVHRTSHSNFYASHPAYLSENFNGGQEQILYLNYLFSKIKGSNLPEGVLCTLLERGQVSPEQIRTAFPRSGNDLLCRAVRLLN